MNVLIDHHAIRIRNGEIEKGETRENEKKLNVKVLIDHHASRIKNGEIDIKETRK